jgi:hypothetical protein
VRFAPAIVGAMLLTGFGVVPGGADTRVALVVGNASYSHIGALANPSNDAKLVAGTLRDLGFALIGGSAQVDLDKAGFEQALQTFGNALIGADVAVFYYAGHGIQVGGANYLIPVNANPTREADVPLQMINANIVLAQMEGSGTRLNIMILDACRNNPLAGRSLRAAGAGLAQMSAPEGTLISFATQPGNAALDGIDGHSPYTRALAQTIRKPGLGIFDTFNEVGLAVAQATGGTQKPWMSNSPIKGTFYFSAAPAALAAVPAPAGDAERAWAAVKDTNSIAILEEFRRQYSGSLYAGFASARIDELKRAQAGAGAPRVALGSPSPVPSGYDPVGTVRAFYLALGGADGTTAAALVVPEKRGSGPLSARSIEQFFSAVREPLTIVSVERAGSDLVNARYRFTRGDGSVCEGDAKVTTRFENGKTLIRSISANC